MKKVYCKIQVNHNGEYKTKLVDGYYFNNHLFIHRTYQDKGWQVSHSCGLLCIPYPVETFKRAQEIAKKLIELVPDWSDVETMSKTEKYSLVRDYLRELISEYCGSL